MIQQVILKNFRCFKELSLNFQKCHGIIGENGNGKTAILEAIDIASSKGAGSYRIDEQDFNWDDEGDVEIVVYFDKLFFVKMPDGFTTQAIPCNGVRFYAKRRERAAPGKALSDSFVVEHHAVPIEYKINQPPNFPDTEEIAKLNKPPFVVLKETFEGEKRYEAGRKTSDKPFQFTVRRLTLQNDLVGFPDVFYFDKGREKETKIGFNSLLQKISKDLNWRYQKDARENQAAILKLWDAYYSRVIGTVEDPKGDRIIHPVQTRIKELLGKDFNNLEMSLLEIEQPFSKAFLSLRSNVNQVQQSNLGSGVSILIAYLFIETISKLAKNEFIFLVDEPELHLHPQVQHALLRDFQKAEYQVVYSTQSDCLVDISEWRGICRINPNYQAAPKDSELNKIADGKKVIEHLDEIKKYHRHRTVLFREDNQLFFSKKCLLVEGPAEKYGLPILAEKSSLDLNTITIISCNGKPKIPDYQLLCKAFEIPYFTLWDLDGNQAEEKVLNDKVKKWCDGSNFGHFNTSFETAFGVGAGDHKASKTLAKLENIDSTAIPPEVKKILKQISTWATSV